MSLLCTLACDFQSFNDMLNPTFILDWRLFAYSLTQPPHVYQRYLPDAKYFLELLKCSLFDFRETFKEINLRKVNQWNIFTGCVEHDRSRRWIVTENIVTSHKKKYHGTLPMYHGTLPMYHGTLPMYHGTLAMYHGTVVMYHVAFSYGLDRRM